MKKTIELKTQEIEITINNEREQNFVNLIELKIDLVRKIYREDTFAPHTFTTCSRMCYEITTYMSALYYLDCIAAPTNLITLEDVINE